MEQTAFSAFPPETNLVLLIRQVQNAISAPYTLEYFNSLPFAIQSLRKMNHFHNNLFNECFNNLIDRFNANFLNEKNSNQFILALSLVKDIFSNYKEDFNTNWISVLIPSIAKGLLSFNKALQMLCQECFELLSKNMLYTSTLIALIELIYANEGNAIASTSINAIKLQCDSFPIISIVYSIDWNEIIETIQNLSDPEVNAKGARTLMGNYFNYLKQLIEKDNQWDEFTALLTKNNKELFFSLIQ